MVPAEKPRLVMQLPTLSDSFQTRSKVQPDGIQTCNPARRPNQTQARHRHHCSEPSRLALNPHPYPRPRLFNPAT